MEVNEKAIYEGESIKIGGKEYIVPGLSLGQMEEMTDKIEKLEGIGDKLTKEMVQLISEICHAALSRNYPGLTLEEVKNILDIRNMQSVLEAVLGASGLVKSTLAGGNGANGTTLKRNGL